MSEFTKQGKVLAIIRDAERIEIRAIHAQYRAKHKEGISKKYLERCVDILKNDGVIVSVGRGVYQHKAKHEEEVKRNAVWVLHRAMRSKPTAPPRIRAIKDIPVVYWQPAVGFGKGQECVVIIPVGTIGQYDETSDKYVFQVPGRPVAYRRWTAAHFTGFFEEA